MWFLVNLLEYTAAHFISHASDVTADFLRGMKRYVGSSKLWIRELRFLKLLTMEVYYPIRPTNIKFYSHYVQVYSLNTSDLLIAFK